MHPRARATVEDLNRVPDKGKAGLVDEEVVATSPTGAIPDRAGGGIYVALRDYERSEGGGYAFPDSVRLVVDPARRGSSGPDAAFHPGPLAGEGRFLDGALFAAAAWSKGDHGARAGLEMAEKRADYFAADIPVVQDVNVLCERDVCVCRAENPDSLAVYRVGNAAEAEPALPG